MNLLSRQVDMHMQTASPTVFLHHLVQENTIVVQLILMNDLGITTSQLIRSSGFTSSTDLSTGECLMIGL